VAFGEDQSRKRAGIAAQINAWGLPNFYPGDASKALLECGKAAYPALRRMLSDKRPALVYGGKLRMISQRYGFRVCDYPLFFLNESAGAAELCGAGSSRRKGRADQGNGKVVGIARLFGGACQILAAPWLPLGNHSGSATIVGGPAVPRCESRRCWARAASPAIPDTDNGQPQGSEATATSNEVTVAPWSGGGFSNGEPSLRGRPEKLERFAKL